METVEPNKPLKVHLFGQNRIVWIYSNRILLFVRQSHWKPFSDGLINRINVITRLEFRSPEDKVRWNEFIIYAPGLHTPEDVQAFFQSPQKEKPLAMARKNKKPAPVKKLEWNDFNSPPKDAQAKTTAPTTRQPEKKQKTKLFRKQIKCDGNRAIK